MEKKQKISPEKRLRIEQLLLRTQSVHNPPWFCSRIPSSTFCSFATKVCTASLERAGTVMANNRWKTACLKASAEKVEKEESVLSDDVSKITGWRWYSPAAICNKPIMEGRFSATNIVLPDTNPMRRTFCCSKTEEKTKNQKPKNQKSKFDFFGIFRIRSTTTQGHANGRSRRYFY